MPNMPQTRKKRGHLSRNTIAALLIVAAVLLAGRIYLPFWVTDYVNRQIAQLDGYRGKIDGVGISLWRGAYQIYGLDIHKRDGLKEPFVAAKLIDLSVEWKALLHGRIVAEIDIHDIALNFAKGQSGKGGGFGDFINSLTPFDINRLEVTGGRVAYLDYTASPDVNLYIQDVSMLVTNLRNIEDRNERLPSRLEVSGTSIGDGKLKITGKGNILRDVPDFDIDARLEKAQLPAFNDYTRAAAAIDFDKGNASFYSELAAADGRLTGYVKFIADDVTMINLRTQDNIFNAMWESLAATFMAIFKNHSEDQFALRLPIEGRIDNPQGSAWSAFFSVFSNAFGTAFPRDTDGNINFRDALNKGIEENKRAEQQRTYPYQGDQNIKNQ